MDLFNDFSIGLFVWQTVLFLALLFLLRKYAWKPILSAVEEREEGIKNALEAADNAKKEMEALNADNERILREAKAERDSIYVRTGGVVAINVSKFKKNKKIYSKSKIGHILIDERASFSIKSLLDLKIAK